MNEEGVTTNVMHLTFEADEPVPAVLPRSYGESEFINFLKFKLINQILDYYTHTRFEPVVEDFYV